jgi:ketosteroid isomerase-like protein
MSDTEGTIRSFYDALARGDADTAFGLFDPSIEWEETERSPYYAGVVVGTAAIVETVFSPINREFDGFACTELDFITQGDRTAVLGSYIGRRRSTGRELKAPFVHVWRVGDGAIVRFNQYTDTAAWASTT